MALLLFAPKVFHLRCHAKVCETDKEFRHISTIGVIPMTNFRSLIVILFVFVFNTAFVCSSAFAQSNVDCEKLIQYAHIVSTFKCGDIMPPVKPVLTTASSTLLRPLLKKPQLEQGEFESDTNYNNRVQKQKEQFEKEYQTALKVYEQQCSSLQRKYQKVYDTAMKKCKEDFESYNKLCSVGKNPKPFEIKFYATIIRESTKKTRNNKSYHTSKIECWTCNGCRENNKCYQQHTFCLH
jgi:hypothetical protein